MFSRISCARSLEQGGWTACSLASPGRMRITSTNDSVCYKRQRWFSTLSFVADAVPRTAFGSDGVYVEIVCGAASSTENFPAEKRSAEKLSAETSFVEEYSAEKLSAEKSTLKKSCSRNSSSEKSRVFVAVADALTTWLVGGRIFRGRFLHRWFFSAKVLQKIFCQRFLRAGSPHE